MAVAPISVGRRVMKDRVIAAISDAIRGINRQIGTQGAKLPKETARLRGMPAEASARRHAAMR